MPSPTDRSPLPLAEFRRELHRHPELRFQEHRTAALLAARLAHSGFEVVTGVAGTGVVATRGDLSARPHVILRADMDAVPTPDLKSVSYASEVPGVAHACGHDVHMAVVLGVGERVAAQGSLAGRITLVFQPAEEIPFGERSGARAMIEAGVLDRGAVDVVLGLHCWPQLPAGVIGLDRRVAMAAKDAFRIRLRGSAAHAATPSRGRDAILAISQLVVSLHHLVAREIDPNDRAALNVGTIRGGASQSIVPAEAEITGTVRTVDPLVRGRLRSAIQRIVAATGDLSAVVPELEWANEMPPVVNDPRLVERAHAIVSATLGPDSVRLLEAPPMTTDDFALYAERVPALYLKLGVSPPGDGECPPLHDGRFDVDERAIDVGVAALWALVRDLVVHPVGDSR